MKVTGRLVNGIGDFRKRMTTYADVFTRVVGHELFAGTLNIEISRPLAVREDFRIVGHDIDEPEQDLIFERCRILGRPAYRIRPYQLLTGGGGHGDHILEIASREELRPLLVGREGRVELEFFR
jgi:CTP-dependent riboflavin kinase